MARNKTMKTSPASFVLLLFINLLLMPYFAFKNSALWALGSEDKVICFFPELYGALLHLSCFVNLLAWLFSTWISWPTKNQYIFFLCKMFLAESFFLYCFSSFMVCKNNYGIWKVFQRKILKIVPNGNFWQILYKSVSVMGQSILRITLFASGCDVVNDLSRWCLLPLGRWIRATVGGKVMHSYPVFTQTIPG